MLAAIALAALSLSLPGQDFAQADDPARANDEPPPVRGVVRPRTQAVISTDLSFAVRSAPVLEGQRFRKGDLLLTFDCRRLEAEFQSVKAQHDEARLTAENSAYLHARKALGKFDLDIAHARVAKAAADIAAVSARLDQCSVVAPYDGRVAELLIREHETPQPGKPLLTVLSDQDLEIELIVPSSWLAWLEMGASFAFSIDETQSRHEAEIIRIGAAVDPVSQTVKAVGRFRESQARNSRRHERYGAVSKGRQLIPSSRSLTGRSCGLPDAPEGRRDIAAGGAKRNPWTCRSHSISPRRGEGILFEREAPLPLRGR